MSLRSQLFFLQLLIVLIIVLVAGTVAVRLQEQQIRDAYQGRMVGVAQSIAQLPSVVDAFDDEDPSAVIQPIAELTTQATGVTYVVVTDDVGIRYSHPNPDMIGQMVSTDPSVPLSGETFVGTQTGTLGESWRVKVPIRGEDGTVIGTASVGTLESTLAADLQEDLPVLLAWLIVAALAGTAGSIWISRLVWRRIYRLEPEEIAALLETRDAMLHGIGEGVVAVDERGRLAVLNDEAKRLLELGDEVKGQPANAVLEPALAGMFGSAGDADETVLVGERVLLARSSDAVGSNGTIHVRLTSDAGGCSIAVSDDGPGIPEHLRSQVFATGFSTKDAAGAGSRGFGLALVQRVAERRAGSVTLTESVLGGAHIAVTLGPAPVPLEQKFPSSVEPHAAGVLAP